MKKTILHFILFSTALFFLNAVYSNVPNTDDPTTFLGPTIKGSYSRPLPYDNAFSVLGEAGVKNLRVGGTYGWQFLDNQRIKFSAEYLRQKITYGFFSGNVHQWVDQGAVGAGYQWDIACNNYFPQFDLSAYYSYAPSKNLSTVNGIFSNGAGNVVPFIDERHIAGSNAAGLEPGITVSPWSSGRLSLDLNYDHVHYRKRYVPSENANGLGGTIKLDQGVYEGVDINLAAAFRQPFNNYFAKLAWTPSQYNNWRFGIDGSYTVGKETLPDTYNAGINIDYLFDCPSAHPAISLKGESFMPMFASSESVSRTRFVNWVGNPAVYMPQVLAIADGRTTLCEAPDVIASAIPPVEDVTAPNFTFDVPTASSFNGNGSTLTFSMVQETNMDLGTPPVITINSTTGVVTIQTFDQPYSGVSNITVTASNGCKSASSLLVVTYEID